MLLIDWNHHVCLHRLSSSSWLEGPRRISARYDWWHVNQDLAPPGSAREPSMSHPQVGGMWDPSESGLLLESLDVQVTHRGVQGVPQWTAMGRVKCTRGAGKPALIASGTAGLILWQSVCTQPPSCLPLTSTNEIASPQCGKSTQDLTCFHTILCAGSSYFFVKLLPFTTAHLCELRA